MNNFDWQYYLDKYPDLRANGVHTEQQALQHWFNHGEKEGRSYFKQLYPIHFITYANSVFERAKTRLINQAKEFYPFKSIKGYGPEDFPIDFTQQFKNILNMERGGGYWIWRPIILKQKLDEINENEFLIFLDSGCNLNPKGISRFNEYIDLLEKSEFGAMSFQMSGNKGPGTFLKEKCWTTTEIFNYFNLDLNSDIGNSGQYLGGILILKKNKHLMNLIELYIKALYDNPLMFTDYYNNINQHSEFIDNRHDQSVFSILRKLNGSVVIDGDESWMSPFGEGVSLKYPFWATRSRD